MKANPFLISDEGSGEMLQPVEAGERAYSEAWLQELLRIHPDILPVADIEPVYYPLVPIGREVGTETGAIDNLFISPRGYPVLVETKLWRNPEAKREVVAQAIDYASSLSKWTYGRMNEATRAYLAKYENLELDLPDWVKQRHKRLEGGRVFFEETVAKNLRLGRFLTLIVGDRIRPSVVEMLDYINRYPHLATDVALVELHCYRWQEGQEWPLLVVPSIVARTEVVERSVIQVTVSPAGTYEVDAHQARVEEKDRARKRITLTEEAFWEMLEAKAPGKRDAVRQLIDRYKDRDNISIDPKQSSIVVKLDIPGTGRQASVFIVYKDAKLEVRPPALSGQLAEAGLPRGPAERYGAEMRRILNAPEHRKEFGRSLTEVDLGDLTAAVDALIEEVLQEAAKL